MLPSFFEQKEFFFLSLERYSSILKTRLKKCQNPPKNLKAPTKTPPPPILCSLPQKNNQKKTPYNNTSQT